MEPTIMQATPSFVATVNEGAMPNLSPRRL
jgi:hypothetical protein